MGRRPRGAASCRHGYRIPDFGDVVGLRRPYRAAVENIRQADLPEADKRAWIVELTRQYRVAVADAS